MITIISSSNHVSISILESIEIIKEENSYVLFMNNYEMLKMSILDNHEYGKMLKIRNKILRIYHSKKNGIYKITPYGELIKLKRSKNKK